MTASGRSRRGDAAIIEALLVGASQAEAARHAGVSERTVRRRLQEAPFRARFAKAEAEIVHQVRRRITASATSAVNVLRTIASDEKVPPATRVHAARGILVAFAAQQPSEIELNAKLTAPPGDATDAIAKLKSTIAEMAQNTAASIPRPTPLPSNGDTESPLSPGNAPFAIRSAAGSILPGR